jgi:Glycine cleavage system protein P (pyridoxal-binding), N-terminal domain
MVDQIPNLGRESEMLEELGLSSISDLFSNIPEGVRRNNPLPLPPPRPKRKF